VVPTAQSRQHYGAFLHGAPLALTLGSPLSGALLEMHGFMGHPGWFWMFLIEGLLAVSAGIFTFFWLDDTPAQARFLTPQEKGVLEAQLASEEESKVTSRLTDALRNGRVWQLAIIYLTIQVAVYGLIFSCRRKWPHCWGQKWGSPPLSSPLSLDCRPVWYLAYSSLFR
jgi:MFS family permease